ncbi:MAG: hypothetical protein KGJ34_02300 [Patescibacteria group bacterium]|nr:hypothetical protein [Patescibacteria group bacterium]
MVLVIAFVVFMGRGISGYLWKGLAVLSPVTGGIGSGARAVYAELESKPGLLAENEALQSQVAALQSELTDYNAVIEENIELKAQFGRLDSAQSAILAGVIAAPPRTPYDTLEIDAGTDEGISVGDLVSAGNGLLIGTVDTALSSSARVTLFSSAGETQQGYLRGSTPVTVIGQGSGSLTTTIPAGINASVGDVINFPGIAGDVSEVVSALEAPSGNSFETLYLHLPVDPYSLRFVSVRLTAAQ